MASPILRQIDEVNALTLCGLGLSLLSATYSIQHLFAQALICLVGCGLVDMFDGALARRSKKRTPTQAGVGHQLDSLVDLCAFGFSPAVFCYCFGLTGPWLALLILYVAANAARLAYFNVAGMTEEGMVKYYTGLPVTFASPAFSLCFLSRFALPAEATRWVLAAVAAALMLAMVSGVKIPKPRGAMLAFMALSGAVVISVYTWAIATGRSLG